MYDRNHTSIAIFISSSEHKTESETNMLHGFQDVHFIHHLCRKLLEHQQITYTRNCKKELLTKQQPYGRMKGRIAQHGGQESRRSVSSRPTESTMNATSTISHSTHQICSAWLAVQLFNKPDQDQDNLTLIAHNFIIHSFWHEFKQLTKFSYFMNTGWKTVHCVHFLMLPVSFMAYVHNELNMHVCIEISRCIRMSPVDSWVNQYRTTFKMSNYDNQLGVC